MTPEQFETLCKKIDNITSSLTMLQLSISIFFAIFFLTYLLK